MSSVPASEAIPSSRPVEELDPPGRPQPPSDGEGPPLASALATLLCALATAAGWLAGDHRAAIGLFLVAYVAGGAQTSITAARELWHRQLNIDLLMILAAIGAALLGDWVEGCILLFLFSLSNTLEAFALYRTRRSIDALVRLRPSEANLVTPEGERRVPVERLALGDVVRVRPGERYPVDALIVEGETWADESTLTGESEPVAKGPGSPVYAGTINKQGSVTARMNRPIADSTVERIVRTVREAQAAQSSTQRFVEWWEAPYVTGVLILSFCVFLGFRFLHGAEFHESFYRAMVVMVVCSPCALVIGPPAAALSAIARAGLHGVLFKGGSYLELLAGVDAVAFDKTGTITLGSPRVHEIWVDPPGPENEARILRLAAAVELKSEHHLARAIVTEARNRGLIDPPEPSVREFHAHSGQGVHGLVDHTTWVGVGRESLFASHDVQMPAPAIQALNDARQAGRTALIVLVQEAGKTDLGVISIAEGVRPGAARTFNRLRQLGIRDLVILTGDDHRVAQAVAREVGASDFLAGLMPEEKVIELRHLRDRGRRVAMVGDGVNDAPALAAAEVGIAMGGAGTDVALEVADVVLMKDDLDALPFAFWLSRQSRRRVHQNLAFAAAAIATLLVLSFFNLPLWMGVIGHEGSTVLVVLNGLRLFWDQPPRDWT